MMGGGVKEKCVDPLSSGARSCATCDDMIDAECGGKKERKKNGDSLL